MILTFGHSLTLGSAHCPPACCPVIAIDFPWTEIQQDEHGVENKDNTMKHKKSINSCDDK